MQQNRSFVVETKCLVGATEPDRYSIKLSLQSFFMTLVLGEVSGNVTLAVRTG